MGYLLLKKEILIERGIKYFETLPDGRGIVDLGMIRVLGSVPNVQIVSSVSEIKKLKEEQLKQIAKQGNSAFENPSEMDPYHANEKEQVGSETEQNPDPANEKEQVGSETEQNPDPVIEKEQVGSETEQNPYPTEDPVTQEVSDSGTINVINQTEKGGKK